MHQISAKNNKTKQKQITTIEQNKTETTTIEQNKTKNTTKITMLDKVFEKIGSSKYKIPLIC